MEGKVQGKERGREIGCIVLHSYGDVPLVCLELLM
jgi:hypothetical protein